jgi:cellulase/cellobiase CelA1
MEVRARNVPEAAPERWAAVRLGAPDLRRREGPGRGAAAHGPARAVDRLLGRRDDRIELLRYGVDALAALPNATIYLEGGASDWEPAKRTANQLKAIGIAKVRGFMLNATHYDWTNANLQHGLDISRRVGGKHFVINTAENGRGPVHRRLPNGRRQTVWCNPPGRGLGPGPVDRVVRTAGAGVRAPRHGLDQPAVGALPRIGGTG